VIGHGPSPYQQCSYTQGAMNGKHLNSGIWINCSACWSEKKCYWETLIDTSTSINRFNYKLHACMAVLKSRA
jgi:hypothetical protein